MTLVRLKYFGFPFPNTYYAKVSSDVFSNFIGGIEYIINAIHDNCYIIIGIIISVFNFTKYRLLTVFCFIPLIISLCVGGDHFEYSRIFQPFIPFYLVLAVIHFNKLNLLKKHSVFIIIVVSGFLPNSGRFHQIKGRGKMQIEWEISKTGILNGQFLNDFFSPMEIMPSVGVIATGGFGYSYKGETIDLLGLNNVEMAHYNSIKTGYKNHGSFEADVFFSQIPNIILYPNSIFNNESLDNNVYIVEPIGYLKEIEKTELFNEYYNYVKIERNSKSFVGFVSKKFIEKIDYPFSISILTPIYIDG